MDEREHVPGSQAERLDIAKKNILFHALPRVAQRVVQTYVVFSRVSSRLASLTTAALYFGGFAGLPLLWLINYIYFYQVYRSTSQMPAEIRHYATRSLFGFIVALCAVLVWAFARPSLLGSDTLRLKIEDVL